MAHAQQIAWCERVKAKLPEHFTGKRVLDVGSYCINGDNRYLFTDCRYVGIDVARGPNVDLVITAGALMRSGNMKGWFETIVSTECMEHNAVWEDDLAAIEYLLAPGGLFLLTCAGEGRAEHGTTRSKPWDAPGLPWPTYYHNLTVGEVSKVLDLARFSEFKFDRNDEVCDLYFYGVKTLSE